LAGGGAANQIGVLWMRMPEFHSRVVWWLPECDGDDAGDDTEVDELDDPDEISRETVLAELVDTVREHFDGTESRVA
jgi:hypothetical protein